MRYEEWAPPTDLEPVVQALWRVTGEVGGAIRVLPDACLDLIWVGADGVLLNGPMSVASIAPLRSRETLGLRFRPGTRVRVPGLTSNAAIRNADMLVETAAGRGTESRLLATARSLLAFGALSRHPEVDVVLAELDRSESGLNEIYERFGLSERTLQRLFDVYVGLSPKQTAVVIRQSLATRVLRDGGKTDLAELAAELGYSDQAHFTRQFRRQTGLPPGGYAREIRDVEFVLEADKPVRGD